MSNKMIQCCNHEKKSQNYDKNHYYDKSSYNYEKLWTKMSNYEIKSQNYDKISSLSWEKVTIMRWEVEIMN